MDNVLLVSGIACVIAAVIGGGLKAFGIEIPALSSLGRQGLLGAVGVVLILIGTDGASLIMKQRASEGPTVNRAPVKTEAATQPVEDRRPPDAGGPISVVVNNNPRVVAPGGSTQITVMATTSSNVPLQGAQVVLAMGGGVFQSTGSTKVVGTTNEQGLFTATWSTYEASAYTGDMSYLVNVQVTKDGYDSGRTELSIPIRR